MCRITVATPGYWRKAGRPTHPQDLKAHDCIVYTGLATVDEWHFVAPDGTPQVVRVKGRVRASASEGMRSAVLEGLGVAVVPTWLFTDEVERGLLQRVLTDYEHAHPGRHAFPPHDPAPRARLLRLPSGGVPHGPTTVAGDFDVIEAKDG